MSTATPVRVHAETPSQVASSTTSSVEQLVLRLAAEVAAATQRIHTLQTKAAKVFLGQEQRYLRFVALTERIQLILQPRIEVFLKVKEYQGRTYHFYTRESLQAFEDHPSEYVETRAATTAVDANATSNQANSKRFNAGVLG